MLGAVERRPRDLGHPGVELREEVALASGVHHVDAGRHDRAGARDEVGAGLDLEAEAPAVPRLEARAAPRARARPTSPRSTVGSSGMRPTLNPPPRLTAWTSGSFAASSSVIRMHRFHTSGSVPEPTCEWSRVMRRRCRSATALTSSRYSCQIPKLDGGPPGVRPLGRAGAEPRVHPHRHLAPRRDLPEALELMERARVEQDSAPDVLGQAPRRHLRGELDLRRREPRLGWPARPRSRSTRRCAARAPGTPAGSRGSGSPSSRSAA